MPCKRKEIIRVLSWILAIMESSPIVVSSKFTQIHLYRKSILHPRHEFTIPPHESRWACSYFTWVDHQLFEQIAEDTTCLNFRDVIQVNSWPFADYHPQQQLKYQRSYRKALSPNLTMVISDFSCSAYFSGILESHLIFQDFKQPKFS